MQAANGRVVLSPSDLNDYVECPHLTTLSLEVARDARRRTYVAEDYGNLLRDKGKEHEAAYLAELRTRGRQVVNVIGANEWDFDTSARSAAPRRPSLTRWSTAPSASSVKCATSKGRGKIT